MCPGGPVLAAGVGAPGMRCSAGKACSAPCCSWVSRGSFRFETVAGRRRARLLPGPICVEWPGAGRALRALPVAGAGPGVGTGADRLPGRARDPPRRCPQRCVRHSARAAHNVAADGPALKVRGPPATDLAASRVRPGRHHASHLPGGRFPWGLAFRGAAVADEGFGVSCGDVLRPERGRYAWPASCAGAMRAPARRGQRAERARPPAAPAGAPARPRSPRGKRTPRSAG